MIMVDQMRFPRFGYGEDHGFVDPLKRILGFQDNAHDSNEFRKFFPGFSALANNAVVLNNHKTASAACVPSRTVLFTGQYGTRTGALQTDGVFKDGASPKFPWLPVGTFPTMGHWMRENGYTTHYFGKWHISGEETTDLEDYGFSDWELSQPDPHGTLPNNLGYYRDYQFEDVVTSFLRRQGLGVPYNIAHAKANVQEAQGEEPMKVSEEPTPWFAVSSFTNPHDIGSYPGLPSTVSDARVAGAPYTLAVPPQGAKGALPKSGTMVIELNRLGFPQNNANVPPTWNEDLNNNNKPSCQFDYAYKMGLTLASKAGRLVSEKAAAEADERIGPDAQFKIAVEATLAHNKIGLPFALTEDPELASRSFMQYYGYVMHEVDQHISAVLKALDESGQADNTIVIFCPDHGEYGASHHMMMEKWHSAYEELVHVPMVVRFPLALHQVPGGLKQVSDVTSHVDLLPTILGFSGVNSEHQTAIKDALENQMQEDAVTNKFTHVLDPVGVDLSQFVLGKESIIKATSDTKDVRERDGVLFISHDTITEPFLGEQLVAKTPVDLDRPPTQYEVYNAAVDQLIEGGLQLAPGPVLQPNNVHCVIHKDNWKLVRYFEPSLKNSTDYTQNNQFELYDLNTDPNEQCNLVHFKVAVPTAIAADRIPASLQGVNIQAQADKLMGLLEQLESEML